MHTCIPWHGLKRSWLSCSTWVKGGNKNTPSLHLPQRQNLNVTTSILSYLSRSLADRWGTTVDFTTSFLHSLRFSAFGSSIFYSRPVHSLMLSSHHFLCLPLRLPPWTVPCWIVLASPDGRVKCPYHFSLRLFTTSMVKFKYNHICKNLTKNGERQRYSWECSRRKRTKTSVNNVM